MFNLTIPGSNKGFVHTKTRQSGEITDRAHAEPSKWMRLIRTLIASLWQRRPRWDVESMYRPDPRDFPSPDSFKPTSLSEKFVADIWLLNSKL